MTKEYKKESYLITSDSGRVDVSLVHQFLTESYWAKGISFEKVKKSVENSICFSLFEEDKQIGFARVITDRARIAYLADVFILEPYRGRGLSKWLIACIMAYPDLQGLTKWILVTKDAHELYRKFGFKDIKAPEMYMEIKKF